MEPKRANPITQVRRTITPCPFFGINIRGRPSSGEAGRVGLIIVDPPAVEQLLPGFPRVGMRLGAVSFFVSDGMIE